jgi:hypothetical protein
LRARQTRIEDKLVALSLLEDARPMTAPERAAHWEKCSALLTQLDAVRAQRAELMLKYGVIHF